MKIRASLSILRWIALLLLFGALVLTMTQLVRFSRVRSYYPSGQKIAGVPVGGLDRAGAAQRITEIYATPIELRYADAAIQIRPSTVGFVLDLESMLSAADLQRNSIDFWTAFWDYLWGRAQQPSAVPLRANLSLDRVRAYLEGEIAARYDRPPSEAVPVPGSVNFQSGDPGMVLDVDRAVELVDTALRSPTSRTVSLTVRTSAPTRPSMANLQILLQQLIDLAGYTGVAEMYVQNLQTAETIHFAYQQGQTLPPDIAFTAASTIKIPVMISVYRRIPEPTPEEVRPLLVTMIEDSLNESTDAVAREVVGRDSGPLDITDDMRVLGLQNTFWAGYFAPGSPLLYSYQTPANQRSDISTDPDIYNQTTPAEIGMLLDDIYQCAQSGGGALVAAFPGEITQGKCQEMIATLAGNHIGVLLQAGLPEGTQFAHKHGWLTDPADGLVHTIADAGIVYSPGGNYVVSVFLHQTDQLLFPEANQMVAELSLAIYNYFNLPVES